MPKGPMAKPGNKQSDKAKDFKSAIKRLFSELKNYRLLIIISITLAALGSILSIFAPNKLSELTDEISDGLVVNQDNFKQISEMVSKSVSEEKLQKKLPEILNIDLSKETMAEIMSSSDFTSDEKAAFQTVLSNMAQNPNDKKVFSSLLDLPKGILNKLLPETKYENQKITTDDKIALLKMVDSGKLDLPKSVQNILFTEAKIDDVKISAQDQYKFLSIISTLDKDASANELYKKIDKMPDSVQEVVKPFMDMDAINRIALFLVVLYLCSGLFTYIEAICMTNVSNKFARDLRSKISFKINKLPLKYFDNHQSGDVLSRVTNDVDTIAQSMNQSLASLVSSVALFVGTIIMMFITNWILAITAILASLIGFAGMIFILSKSQKYFVARQRELGNLNGHIEEVYSGLNVVKVYNGGDLAAKKFDEYNYKVRESNRISQFISGLMQPMMAFIGNFGYVAVCIVGALLTVNDIISFGVIVAFISYVRLFTSPLSQIAQSMTSLQSTAAASERVFEFVDEPEMANQKNITRKLDAKVALGKIEFENVEFQYDGAEKPTIKNFNAVAQPGQKVAIVGPTGAGKTTMVNLLMKFYEINHGDIKIDGVPIKDLTRENVHDLFTMVLQDTWLFEGTVKENIVYNKQNVSDSEVREVCQEVGLDHFIKTLPHGYDSVIGENDSISAGQRQLMTIARGMLKDAPFLILDEATSNVDTRTEELVQTAMDKLSEGRTSFIIAHRLSTIKNADLILVMKEGDIIEQGNHEELMKKNGAYAELYNSQFEL